MMFFVDVLSYAFAVWVIGCLLTDSKKDAKSEEEDIAYRMIWPWRLYKEIVKLIKEGR